MTLECPKCQTDNPDTKKFCGDCGTPLEADVIHTKTLETPTEELTTGSTFAGRYQIIEELGKGGMGRVYKANDTEIKEKVALKLIKPEISTDKTIIERFRNELKYARKIRHKNVCQMFDLNREEGTHYITMEYVHGEDLKRLIRKMGQMSAGQVISTAMQVCEGIAEAHRLGVVHRDLKPQNIMVDEEGNARIMDFGIARSVKGKGITGAGVMIGTPEYMSPEQVEGKESDQRSDIYSLGVILYEMVTGRVPFEGDTPFTIGVKHKSEAPRNPKELNSQIPDDLSRVILRCMEKDKEKRYQSAGEVRSELENIEKAIPPTEKVIPKRKPITSREITVAFGFKKLVIPALVIIALVILVVVIWQPLSQKETIPTPSDKPSLAIMYFQNNTGDGSLDIWRDGLSRMLIADLSQSKYIRVLPDDQLYGILSQLNLLEAKNYSTEDLREVTTRGKSTHILKGILTRYGDSFRINTTLQESSSMEIIGSEMVEGKGEGSLHTMVDELTRRIKENFRLSEEEIASDIDEEIGKITTSSPEAYKYFNEGIASWVKGDRRKSGELFQQAIAIDPEFASAYQGLASVYGNLGYRSERKKHLQKALELSARVSARERYEIQAQFYTISEETYDKAIEAYNKLLLIYPDDWSAKNSLGLLYRELEQWDNAIEILQSAIEEKVEIYFPYVNLAITYTLKGLYNEAQDVLEYYLNNISEHAGIHNYLRLNYLVQGKYNLALIEFDKAFSINPNYFIPRHYRYYKGDIYFLMENLSEARKEYEKYKERNEPIALAWGKRKLAALFIVEGKFEIAKEQIQQGIELAKKSNEKEVELSLRSSLGYLNFKSGNYKGALVEINRAWNGFIELDSLSGQRSVSYRRGLIYLQMKSLNEAQKEADELNRLIEKGFNKRAKRYYSHLIGMMELYREDYSKAIEYFNEAITLQPHHGLQKNAEFIESLAQAYFLEGEIDKAKEEYERITSLTTGRFWLGDLYAKSFYMLGKIYEQQSNSAKAIEHYEKFLDLWKDADPGIAEVDDAKKRQAALKNH